MSRFTGLKRRLIFAFGEMLSPGNTSQEHFHEKKRKRQDGKKQQRAGAGGFIFLLIVLSAAIIYTAAGKLYAAHQSQAEPLARMEEYQKKLDEAQALNEQLERENRSLQDSFEQTREEMLKDFNYNSPENQTLLDQYQTALVMAGMTEYKGPGIRITMQDKEERSEDSKRAVTQIIHDADLRYVVDLLKQQYVRALAVNDERLAPMSPLICTGPSVLVNRVYKAAPFVITGGTEHPEALAEVFRTSEGYKKFEERGLRIQIEVLDELDIPAQRDMTYVNAQAEKLEAKK